MDYHDSKEHPPVKRFFGKSASAKNKRRHEDSDGEDAPTVDLASIGAENAPGRENERDKIMRQLRELCHLRDIGETSFIEHNAQRTHIITNKTNENANKRNLHEKAYHQAKIMHVV